MKKDPIIDEIRRVRHEISKSVGHDSRRLVELYMVQQEKHKEKLIHKSTKLHTLELISSKS